jgi:hypothetical protein
LILASIRGSIRSRQGRISDILNQADEDFLVLTDTVVDEYGARGTAVKSEYAQVNLGAVLFAVADTTVEPRAAINSRSGSSASST